MVNLIFVLLLPFVSAAIMPCLKSLKNRNIKMAIIVALQSVITLFGVLCVFGEEVKTPSLTFAKNITLGFTTDAFGKFFALLAVVAWLIVTVYGTVYMKHEKQEERFFLFSFLSEGAMLCAAFSDSLSGMYFFYEMITLASMPLVLHDLSEKSVAAAKKYLFYSIGGAFFALFGIFVLAANGSLAFTSGGNHIEKTNLTLLASLFVCIGFGAKAGLFPLHSWLPTAHPVAPSPASALLSGIIAKAGVLGIVRTVFYTLGGSNLTNTWVQTTLIIIALFTVLMGSVLAFRENVLKKRLAYSTVSQISYLLIGLFLFSENGTTGALLQIIFHAAVKIGLFLCAGAVIYLSGKTTVSELSGLGQKMPITFICFTVLSCSLIGIPPTGGFYSKWYLATAALELEYLGALSFIVPIILLISAIFTAGYLFEVPIKAFLGKQESDIAVQKEPMLMTAPLIVLSLIAVFGGIFISALMPYITSIAASLFA